MGRRSLSLSARPRLTWICPEGENASGEGVSKHPGATKDSPLPMRRWHLPGKGCSWLRPASSPSGCCGETAELVSARSPRLMQPGQALTSEGGRGFRDGARDIHSAPETRDLEQGVTAIHEEPAYPTAALLCRTAIEPASLMKCDVLAAGRSVSSYARDVSWPRVGSLSPSRAGSREDARCGTALCPQQQGWEARRAGKRGTWAAGH